MHSDDNNRPVFNPIFAKQFAAQVLEENQDWLQTYPLPKTKERHRHEPVQQIVNYLTHGHLGNIPYCTAAEANTYVTSGDTLFVINDTSNIDWGGDDPIVSLFKTWSVLSARSTTTRVEVTFPHRFKTQKYKEHKQTGTIERKFMDINYLPEEPAWMIYNFFNPLPNTEPPFLRFPNARLLQCIEQKKGIIAKGNPENIMLVEGGNHTATHVDYWGFATYLTVHKGSLGFGWIDIQTVENLREWEKDPLSEEVAKMARYVVLQPRQTIYIPSGTIHFVFRAEEQRTMQTFGDILVWSCIRQWLRVLKRQELSLSMERATRKAVEYYTLPLKAIIAQLLKSDTEENLNRYIHHIGGVDIAREIVETIETWENFDPYKEL
ncbi:ATP synthase subunit alpha [Fusarium denticulatum]|uniref:ATP synthase subunit alpha n=1 Tax=Fusarium denticulatum TaxID=48507 RepID=A0A8H5WFV4_9HYPO|nr:ATP synthase subunit alpha [Fusarium denticulatum]